MTFQLIDYDAKRLHYFEQLFHAADGWVSATSENLSLHVDMTSKKTAAFPHEIASRLAGIGIIREIRGKLQIDQLPTLLMT